MMKDLFNCSTTLHYGGVSVRETCTEISKNPSFGWVSFGTTND